jgi:hypothetical protein
MCGAVWMNPQKYFSSTAHGAQTVPHKIQKPFWASDLATQGFLNQGLRRTLDAAIRIIDQISFEPFDPPNKVSGIKKPLVITLISSLAHNIRSALLSILDPPCHASAPLFTLCRLDNARHQ